MGLHSNWRSYHADYKSYVLFQALMNLSGDIGLYTLIYLTTKFKQQPSPKSFLCKSITSKVFELESWGCAQNEAFLM